MKPVAHSVRTPWLLPVALVALACHDSGPNLRPISLSVTTRSSTSSVSAGLNAGIQIGSGANSLTISKAQLVLARIKLSPSATTSCTETSEDDDCDEIRAGPVLVDLPVDGTTKVVLDALVPAGTYQGLEAKIDAVEADEDEPGVSDFLKAHPDWQGVSVKVTGVFTDASKMDHAFTFSSEVDAHVRAEFKPPVTVGASTSNLTINAKVASWFTDGSGAAIDPTNAANQETIERNIRQSFRAFEDDERDGVDDDAGEHQS